MNFLDILFGKKDLELSPEPSPNLLIQYSSRMHKGWRVRWNRLGQGVLVAPKILENNPEAKDILLQWATLKSKRQSPARKKLTRELEERIYAWLGHQPARLPPIQTQGQFYNLEAQFQKVNAQYFAGRLQCVVTWSARIGGLSFHTEKRNPQSGKITHFISISRAYDFANVPEYAIQGLLYHECLHIVIPVEIHEGRRVVHGTEFKRREKLFANYEAWKKFHRTLCTQNLRTLRQRKRNQKMS